jgi:hypothetical protein
VRRRKTWQRGGSIKPPDAAEALGVGFIHALV